MSKPINKMEQLRALKNGKDIQYILNEAFKILGNPILVHDMEYMIIAYTENIVTDDPIWNEFITNGSVGYDRLVFYRDECFFEMAANAKSITFLLSDKLPYDRLFGKLFTKCNIQIGCACMTATDKPFEDDDPELFETVCDILNEKLCESEFYQAYGQAYMEALTGRLIEDSIEDKDLYIAHIESIYIGTKANLHLAVADIAQRDPTRSKLVYFRDLFTRTQPDFKYSIYTNYIVIIISSDNEMLNIKKDLNKLNMLFEQNNIYAGISGSFENLLELPKYYMEAVNALNYGLKSGDAQRIFKYDEIIHDS